MSEFHAEATQADASERLVHGPYVAARLGIEPYDPSEEWRRIYQCAITPTMVGPLSIGNRWKDASGRPYRS